jgi:hypothetical protein
MLMKAEHAAFDTPHMQAAIMELQGLILQHYPNTTFARLYPFRKRSIANKHLGFSFDTRVFECPVKQPTLKKCKLPTFNGLYYQRFRPYRNG